MYISANQNPICCEFLISTNCVWYLQINITKIQFTIWKISEFWTTVYNFCMTDNFRILSQYTSSLLQLQSNIPKRKLLVFGTTKSNFQTRGVLDFDKTIQLPYRRVHTSAAAMRIQFTFFLMPGPMKLGEGHGRH